MKGWSDFELDDGSATSVGKPVAHRGQRRQYGRARRRLHGAGKGSIRYSTSRSAAASEVDVVVNGEIYHGAGPASEIGHIRLERDGTILEHRCSGWAVDRKIRELISSGRPSVLAIRSPKRKSCEARSW